MRTATSRGATGLVVLCLLVAATAGPAVAAAAASRPTAHPQAGPLEAGAAPRTTPLQTGALQTTPEADTTVTRIRLRADADAVWTLRVRTRLENETDVRGFEQFQSRFAANRSRYLGPFRDRMTAVVADAADATGREMAAANFSATTAVQSVPRRWGVVTFRFRWEGFAETDGDAIVVGDVFQGGLFLGERDSLVVTAPAGYGVSAADPQPTTADAGTVRWDGPLDFADGRPRVRVAPVEATPTGGTATGDRGSGVPVSLSAGVVVILGLAGVAILAFRRRSAGGAAGGSVTTDEERVVALLARNGGRMRQADVAEELGWSASKTSRLLSSMADAGTVEKVRLGRENLVELADEGEE